MSPVSCLFFPLFFPLPSPVSFSPLHLHLSTSLPFPPSRLSHSLSHLLSLLTPSFQDSDTPSHPVRLFLTSHALPFLQARSMKTSSWMTSTTPSPTSQRGREPPSKRKELISFVGTSAALSVHAVSRAVAVEWGEAWDLCAVCIKLVICALSVVTDNMTAYDVRRGGIRQPVKSPQGIALGGWVGGHETRHVCRKVVSQKGDHWRALPAPRGRREGGEGAGREAGLSTRGVGAGGGAGHPRGPRDVKGCIEQ